MASATATPSVFRFDNTIPSVTTRNIFLNDNFADFHFCFDENGVRKRIPAHKAILAAASDVFATMLNGNWKEENEVEVVDASCEAFVEFLQFLYLSEVTVSAENIGKVINLAHMYNVGECVEMCAQKIKQLALDDVCTGLDLALKFDLRELKDFCLAKISGETSEVLTTEGFINCSRDSLKRILELDRVNCKEMEIFNASFSWAERACEVNATDPSILANVREQLGDCLYAVRFGTMSLEEVSSCVTKYGEFFNRCELQDLFVALGPAKCQAKLFTNITKRIKQLCVDDRTLTCDLQLKVARSELLRTESTIFQISKCLLFGGVWVALCFANGFISISGRLSVFEIDEGRHQNEILQQTLETQSTKPQTFLKLERSIRIKPNTDYEIRFQRDSSTTERCDCLNQSIGTNIQISFGDGVVLQTKDKCSNFITKLCFN